MALRTAAVTALAAPPLGSLRRSAWLLTASRPQPRLLVTGGVLLAVLVLLLLRSNRVGSASDEGFAAVDAAAVGVDLAARRRDSLRGRMAFGLPVVAGATALAVVATWLLPAAGPRADPRALRTQTSSSTTRSARSRELRPQLNGPKVAAVHRHRDHPGGQRLPPGPGAHRRARRLRRRAVDRLRQFAVTGSTLPGFSPLGGDPAQVRLEVDGAGGGEPFLPVVGEPERFEGTDFAFDRDTGTVVRTATGPFHYVTEGEIRPQDAALRQAKASNTPARRGVPPAAGPAAVGRPARRPRHATREQASPLAQLLAIEDFLRRQPYSVQAAPGHSYGALKRALLGAPDERVGSAEQYAAAFAVLARALGLSRPGSPSATGCGPSSATGDRYTVYTADAHAWPEVHLRRLRLGALRAHRLRAVRRGAPAARPRGDARGGRPRPAPGRPGSRRPATDRDADRTAVRALARGRRRRAGRPAAAGRGGQGASAGGAGPGAGHRPTGWSRPGRSSSTCCARPGCGCPLSHTGAEVAADVRHGPAAVAARSVDALAPLVSAAVFAAEQPREADAVRAWELLARIRRETAAVLGVGARLRALVDPRPLLPRTWRLRRPGRRAPTPAPAVPAPRRTS